jgi:hypothetical protein
MNYELKMNEEQAKKLASLLENSVRAGRLAAALNAVIACPDPISAEAQSILALVKEAPEQKSKSKT